MAEPSRVAAGDTWSWTRSGGEYPASAGWVLTYFLAQGAEAPKQISGTASGDDFLANVSAASSAAYTPGVYHWKARVAKAGEFHLVGAGILKVDPDPSGTYDRRTENQLALAAIKATLAGLFSDPITEYEVDGFKVKRMDRAELLRLQSVYSARVRLEQRGASSLFKPFPVRFNP